MIQKHGKTRLAQLRYFSRQSKEILAEVAETSQQPASRLYLTNSTVNPPPLPRGSTGTSRRDANLRHAVLT